MIISEQQIMQLMELVKQYCEILLCAHGNKSAKRQFTIATLLLNTIANQQPTELKEIK